MVRTIVTAAALFAGLILPAATAAASPTTVGRLPAGVDAVVLSSPTSTGPIVATGRLEDAQGRGASGTVAALAWPNDAANRAVRVGDTVVTPTVGWARTQADGSFSLPVDAARVTSKYLRPDGSVNLIAIGWTASSQGFTTLSYATASTHSAAATVANIAIRARGEFVGQSAGNLSPTTGAAGTAPAVTCGWILRSTYDAWSYIGQSTSYGQDESWMQSSSSQSEAVGSAVSYQVGGLGGWSQNGTFTTTSGVTFTWANSIYWRSYQVSLHYGKYQWCGVGNTWQTMVISPNGAYTTGTTLNYSYTHCFANSAGQWERNLSTGNHYTNGGGVNLTNFIGINVSVDSNYDSGHILYYKLVASGLICGNNAAPATASEVTTSR